ncbi:MAG: TolB-like 6-bladed beta-propeller domain-containing protein [Muribaculaceae bacterium]|nr:TolB-like 6-bladed beta-propeller domain-containing protein [Muribaculaceae bacterium]
MKSFKILIVAFFILVYICEGCNRTQKKVEYIPDYLATVDVDTVKATLVSSDLELGYPQSIDFITDTLMVILDNQINDYVAHIISTSGKCYNSFGMKGRGKGEIVNPTGVTVSPNCDSVYVFDRSLRRLLGFDIKKILQKEEQEPIEITFDIDRIPNQHYVLDNVEIDSDGTLYGFTIDENRFVTFNPNGSIETYGKYPEVDPDPETNRSIWNYSESMSMSPDRKHIVTASFIGGMFETFDNNDGIITSKATKYFYEPVYDYAQGAIPKYVIRTKDTTLGFCSVQAQNNHFIGVFYGPENMYSNQIMRFDYDGNLLSRKATGIGMAVIGENDKGEVYALGYNGKLYRIEE